MRNVCTRAWCSSVLMILSIAGCSPTFPDSEVSTAPMLRAVAPQLGPTAGGVTLTVEGSNFADGAVVLIDGAPARRVAGTDTRISALLPARPGALGKVSVTVMNPDGRSSRREDLFAYHASQLDFGSATLLTDPGPTDVAVGDLNGDGQQDLTVVNYSRSAVNVLLGDGRGNFGATLSYPVIADPWTAVLGDWNGDGMLDLAVASTTTNYLMVQLGDGLGGFAAANSHLIGRGAFSVVTADFDGDGNLDLATANAFSNDLSVLRGNGRGQFATAYSLPAGRRPQGIAAADLNGDRRADLVVSNSESTSVSVFVANEGGGFNAAVDYPTGLGPLAVALGDA